MPARGPKTKPTNIKILTDTIRNHRLNPNEPKPEAAQPDPPAHLTEAARAEWDRVVVDVVALGLLSNLDRAALAAYCQACGRWSAAETALARMAAKDAVTDGLIIRTKSGNIIQNPLVGAANKAMADMVRYAAEFGMTPSSRTRINAEAYEDDDPADAYFT